MRNGGHSTGETTASLDRIDPRKDYVKGNVQWVHKDVNRIKQAFNEERLLEVCKAIIEHKLHGYTTSSLFKEQRPLGS